MVKLRGPMMSLGASGTLGGAITYTSWKGRSVAREHVIPSNPQSGAQVGRRAMLSFLSKAWDAIAPERKATFQDLADQLVASPFNAYQNLNLHRWHNFQSPSQYIPVTETGEGSDRALTAAVWEENRIKLSTTATTAPTPWGIVYFAKLAGAVTPAVGNAIILELDEDVLARNTFWTPPEVGTWHFNSMTYSDDGALKAAGGAVNAVP